MTRKNNIRELNLDDLKKTVIDLGHKPFRGKQIHNWLWQNMVTDFDAMGNLPLALRTQLNNNFVLDGLSVKNQQVSSDGTVKFGFACADDAVVEGVLIPTTDRKTACVSSQVGCSLDCHFCATGKMKRMRNLKPYEIFDQVKFINQKSEQLYGQKLTNIVFMGMGEPLLNYNNVVEAVKLLTDEVGFNFSPRRITISTSGIAKLIEKLAFDLPKVRLALSLHATNNSLRSGYMSINQTNSLQDLKTAMLNWQSVTGLPVSFEYILFKNLNDQPQHAQEMLSFANGLKAKVNIIEYNPIGYEGFEKSDDEVINKFAAYLSQKGLMTSVRKSRGKDIDAACGQLANK